jgi:hypothetical protein
MESDPKPKKCCMCGREFPVGKSFTLTEAERALMGPNPPTEVHYCKPCLGVAENLQQGSQILRGLFERNLRAAGVPNATAMADLFHKRLLQSATRKLQ